MSQSFFFNRKKKTALNLYISALWFTHFIDIEKMKRWFNSAQSGVELLTCSVIDSGAENDATALWFLQHLQQKLGPV